jgi:hypothetical protein
LGLRGDWMTDRPRPARAERDFDSGDAALTFTDYHSGVLAEFQVRWTASRRPCLSWSSSGVGLSPAIVKRQSGRRQMPECTQRNIVAVSLASTTPPLDQLSSTQRFAISRIDSAYQRCEKVTSRICVEVAFDSASALFHFVGEIQSSPLGRDLSAASVLRQPASCRALNHS